MTKYLVESTDGRKLMFEGSEPPTLEIIEKAFGPARPPAEARGLTGVEVPGQGIIEFPDGMGESEITAALQSLFPSPPSQRVPGNEVERMAMAAHEAGPSGSPERSRALEAMRGTMAKEG